MPEHFRDPTCQIWRQCAAECELGQGTQRPVGAGLCCVPCRLGAGRLEGEADQVSQGLYSGLLRQAKANDVFGNLLEGLLKLITILCAVKLGWLASA